MKATTLEPPRMDGVPFLFVLCVEALVCACAWVGVNAFVLFIFRARSHFCFSRGYAIIVSCGLDAPRTTG